uniref:glucan endo-1,3-beta-glucosidase 8-like n=1 Tax=Erigeron canadensis TaxID=72917 RepID=UPI001CB8908E|nr:glucan endo-1,3-beta-glucosidase 8-like [Erigeron canadensis]
MARAMVLIIWAYHWFLLATITCVNGLGVNWGTQASTPLDPKYIVQMLKDNKIKKVKLFDSDHWTVSHFAGTGIEVMLGIPNLHLKKFSKDYDAVQDYVRENVTDHLRDHGGVNIKYIAVGNEPFLKAYKGAFEKTIFPALKNVQKALNEAGLGKKIKSTIPQNADVYDSGSQGPSAGNFRQDIRDVMVQISRFLDQNNCPFMVNIYPFLSLYENDDFPMEFAFFDGGGQGVQDGNIRYTNMLDANLDTLTYSLKKAGVRKLKIVVGEIGWPTDGHKQANVKIAQKFYDGLLKKLATNKGTPLHPGYIEVYLFSLTDENQKSVAPGYFERHWGIFRYDGQPKFAIDFSGQGNEKMPVGAKNVKYLDHQWCVLNEDMRDMGRLKAAMDYACSRGDCTSLSYGSTCNKLSANKNVSYAFNMYFQMNEQSVEACDFNGAAKLTKKNYSTQECLFPLELMSGATNKHQGITFLLVLVSLMVLF